MGKLSWAGLLHTLIALIVTIAAIFIIKHFVGIGDGGPPTKDAFSAFEMLAIGCVLVSYAVNEVRNFLSGIFFDEQSHQEIHLSIKDVVALLVVIGGSAVIFIAINRLLPLA